MEGLQTGPKHSLRIAQPRRETMPGTLQQRALNSKTADGNRLLGSWPTLPGPT
jgi:hypothetical protein